MRIGIMTFWWSEDNYGQLLQCYALQKYLRDAGHDAYLIRYNFTSDLKTPIGIKLLKALNPYLVFRHLKHRIKAPEERPFFSLRFGYYFYYIYFLFALCFSRIFFALFFPLFEYIFKKRHR